MKRLLTLILSLLLIVCLSGTVFATDDGTVLTIGANNANYVVDNADLLTDSEEAELTRMAEEISQRQHCDVVILTAQTLNGKSPQLFTEDFYVDNDYGFGADRSGMIFLISMEDRDWYLATRGDAIQAITDQGREYMWSKCKSSMSDGDYAEGFRSYLNTVDTMLSAYHGTLSDKEQDAFQRDFNKFIGVRTKPGIVKTTVIALIVGFLLAFLFSASLKSQLKSVRMKYNATNYRRPDSMHLNQNRDVYLYANTTSRVIETQRSSSTGGGSSTHTHSSGATFGGGGGKF